MNKLLVLTALGLFLAVHVAVTLLMTDRALPIRVRGCACSAQRSVRGRVLACRGACATGACALRVRGNELAALWIDYLECVSLQSLSSASAAASSASVSTSGGLRMLGGSQSTGRCAATRSRFAAAWASAGGMS